ncbi:coniferyl aldehyde dehydrogenase [Inhella gelatinilytica]|uniref:Aldehyde dehydrogenase n=1 Tax=Inhella gelatinilytica TaxID=2795030 RepID=A0A931IWU8_9BURK|nr:coniferyl aldehyde dehydrogenase [Inhella gelatinilytica]MBH9552480.1 coniferyl aldehyde dehydrogenase [Inhella gelatinilytica]
MDSSPSESLRPRLDQLRAAYLQEPYPSYSARRDRLTRLRDLLHQHSDAFAQAIREDFGHRSVHETLLTEVFVVEASIKHALRHLKRWMRVRRMPTALHFFPGHNRLMPQPKGVVGIISPWNYPMQLALAPAVAALAAGNRVLLKPSELTPRCSELLAKAVAEHFDADEFQVVLGDASVAAAFSKLPFDHLFFTGSTPVGRLVAQAAAANLTPVTLELGGKSPVVVMADADLRQTAERVAFAKLLNAGQTCVAPDYVLAPRHQVEPLAQAVLAAMRRHYPTLAQNPDYTAIVAPRHYARLQGLLKEAKDKGAQLLRSHDETLDPAQRKLHPTVVLGATEDMALLREEIFGPVLPILPYDRVDEAIAQVQRNDRPLALYIFGKDDALRERILRETHAGGVTSNDCIWHLGQEDQPFGGVGASGQGSYHGEWGFKTFSCEKPVFHNPSLAGTRLFYPPYGARFTRLLNLLRKLS